MLRARQRACLDDANRVANVGGILLVVRVQDGTALDFLAVHGVRHGVLVVDLDGLVSRAGGDETQEGLAVGAVFGHRERELGDGLLLLRRGGLTGKNGHATGDVAAQGAETGGILDGAGGLLEAQAEELFAGFADTLLQFGRSQGAQGRSGGGLIFPVGGHR